jgi:hypothetical protein
VHHTSDSERGRFSLLDISMFDVYTV